MPKKPQILIHFERLNLYSVSSLAIVEWSQKSVTEEKQKNFKKYVEVNTL